MRSSRQMWMLFSMLFVAEGVLSAQAMIEHSLGAGRAAVSTAPAARGVSKSVSGINGNLEKVMKSAGQTAVDGAGTTNETTETVPYSERANPAPAVPAKVYEDPSGIKVGMTNDELVKRFGPPSLDVTSPTARILNYRGRNTIFELELRDDKVGKISAMNAHQSALVLPGK